MKLKLIQLDNQRHKLTRGLLKGPPLRIRTRDEGMDGASERERKRERERQGERFRWEPLRRTRTHTHALPSFSEPNIEAVCVSSPWRSRSADVAALGQACCAEATRKHKFANQCCTKACDAIEGAGSKNHSNCHWHRWCGFIVAGGHSARGLQQSSQGRAFNLAPNRPDLKVSAPPTIIAPQRAN